MADARMRDFWDERAREDAFYFVDNRLKYREPDMEFFWRNAEEALDEVFEELGVRVESTDTVVDIGCGVGRLTRVVAKRAVRVIAMDISEEMLQRAQELNSHLDNVEWLNGDGRSLAGIADEVADACVSQVVFQHIPDPAITLGYIREIGRILCPGGWAAIQVSDDPKVHQPRIPLGDRVLALVGRAPRGREAPEWLGSAVDLDDVRRVSAEAGLDLERILNPGTQFCQLLVRKPSRIAQSRGEGYGVS